MRLGWLSGWTFLLLPSTVTGLLAAADVQRDGVVDWGAMISIGKPGVYIVALTDDVRSASGTVDECPVSLGAIEELLRIRPELRLDGERPSEEALAARIAQFWLADETVFCWVGWCLIKNRVNQYYKTPLGARRPHAGGYFLKFLTNLNDLKVLFAACDDPDKAEDSMRATFCKGVSEHTRQTLRAALQQAREIACGRARGRTRRRNTRSQKPGTSGTDCFHRDVVGQKSRPPFVAGSTHKEEMSSRWTRSLVRGLLAGHILQPTKAYATRLLTTPPLPLEGIENMW